MLFGFTTGMVTEDRAIIRLQDGRRVRMPSFRGELLASGTAVYVSWFTKNGEPRQWRQQLYVDTDAVEPMERWRRQSRYQPKFNRGSAQNRAVEDKTQSLLALAGVRAESASAFEDERLGVDLWVFLKVKGAWIWIPFDVTGRSDLDRFQTDSKYDKAFQAGVIPLAVSKRLLKAAEGKQLGFLAVVLRQFSDSLRDFMVCGKSLLNRQDALRREMEEFGE